MELTMLILLAAVVALQVYSLLFSDMRKHEAKKLDERVDEAMKKEAEKSSAMDEGFENIMRYAVNGHDGFGGEL